MGGSLRSAVLAVTFVIVLLLPAPAAVASCADDSGPDGSPVIFVGTAESERRGYTRFRVDEVWAGPDLAAEVWVLSGQEQPLWPLSLVSGVSSSIDTEFEDGERYVVGATTSFRTGACSVSGVEGTTKPDDPRSPVADGATGADPPIGALGQTLWVGGVLGLIAAADVLRRRIRGS